MEKPVVAFPLFRIEMFIPLDEEAKALALWRRFPSCFFPSQWGLFCLWPFPIGLLNVLFHKNPHV